MNHTSGAADFVPAVPFQTRMIEGSTVGGAFWGYNWQRGNFVFGGEINYSAINNDFAGYNRDEYLEFETTWDPLLEARLRAGYAFGNVLVYGFAGKAFTRLLDDENDEDFSFLGPSYGVGAQMNVYKDVFAGLEVSRRAFEYDSESPEPYSKLVIDIDQISLRIGYSF